VLHMKTFHIELAALFFVTFPDRGRWKAKESKEILQIIFE
jgi:hypothetical protein